MPRFEGRFRVDGSDEMESVVVEADNKYEAQAMVQQSRPELEEGQAPHRLEYFRQVADTTPLTGEADDDAGPGDQAPDSAGSQAPEGESTGDGGDQDDGGTATEGAQ